MYCLVLELLNVKKNLDSLSLSRLLNAFYITIPVFNLMISSNFNKFNSICMVIIINVTYNSN